jgi:hypothetical protein
MKEIEVPKLDYEERYKRIIDGAYVAVLTSDGLVQANVEPKKALEMIRKMHEALGSEIARKLIKKLNLEPNVEGALKLFKLYSCEVWGYGAEQYVSAKLESPSTGIYANLVCRGWELQKRAGKEEEMKKMDCAQGCFSEYSSILKELCPDLKMKMTKAYPWGDDRCEFVVEEQISSEF